MKTILIILTLVFSLQAQWLGWGGFGGYKVSGESIDTTLILDLDYKKGTTLNGSNLVTKWEDQSVKGNDFEATNAPLWTSDGIQFDGVDDYMSLVDATDDFDFTDGSGNDKPFTIMAYVENSDSSKNPIISKANVSNTGSWDWYFRKEVGASYTLRLYSDGSSKYLQVTTNDEPLNTVVTSTYTGGKDTSSVNIYINGMSVSTVKTIANYNGITDGSTVEIGVLLRNTSYVAYLNGKIKRIKIWNRELTASEIATETA